MEKSITDLAGDFMKECCAAASAPKSPGNRPWVKKVESNSMAVDASQVAEVIARNKKYGLHIDYRPTGEPILTTERQSKELARIEREVFQANYGE